MNANGIQLRKKRTFAKLASATNLVVAEAAAVLAVNLLYR